LDKAKCKFYQLNVVGAGTKLALCYENNGGSGSAASSKSNNKLVESESTLANTLGLSSISVSQSGPSVRKQPAACVDLSVVPPPAAPKPNNCSLTPGDVLFQLETARLTNSTMTIDQIENKTRPVGSCDNAVSLKFNLRSTGDIVHFLGDLLYLQNNPPSTQPDAQNGAIISRNIPVTLGYCAENDPSCTNNGGTLFNLIEGKKDGPIVVPYRDHNYAVANDNDRDHTLEVLSIVTQLIGLNKSAKDLTTTPTVQVVP
jgi:hypothetical protein